MKPLIAANWKMNKLPSEAESWTKELLHKLQSEGKHAADIAICAPFPHLNALSSMAVISGRLKIGAQDVSAHDEGAYTGEVSAAMLADIGIHYVIVGHSERREYHREDDALINQKVKGILAHGMTPILCVGEKLAEREGGNAESVVLGQLEANLAGVTLEKAERLVIAYEPVWAIGTGKNATPQDAQDMSKTIRDALQGRYPNLADDIVILYGGSMKPENAQELLSQPDINGGLVGGASLKLDSLLALVEAAG